ncbi:MAG: carboxypeptidase-like regulatory domain-containing protein [Bacteroidales bacterium]|nr:carboxypeptidase-like regulatory domain-containing protein [Bacteroidales bacterium]
MFIKFKLFFIILLLFSSQIFGQQTITIKGKLTDKKTNKKIAFASVGIKNSNIGTISNIDGYFELSFTQKNNYDTIFFSHLNYQYTAKKTSYFKDDSIYNIYLTPENYKLEEVVVTSVPVSEILLKAINNSQSKITVPILFNTYYREFVKKNGVYTKFSDGILDFYIKGKPKKIKHSLIVKESRAFELDNSSFEKLGSFYKIEDALFGYDFKNIRRFFKEKNFDKYIYSISYKRGQNNNDKKIITIKPKKEAKEQLYNAKVIIDDKTNLILKIEYDFSKSHQKYADTVNVVVAKARRFKDKTILQYKVSPNFYTISHIANNISIVMWAAGNKYYLDFINDLIVTDFKTKEIDFNKKKKYKNRSLYENDSNYSYEFWKNNNTIPLTKEEENIIKILNKKTQKTNVQKTNKIKNLHKSNIQTNN